MAEVGVLNLTIHDNSEQAATGLTNLADALSRVKKACDAGKLEAYADALGKVSKAIERGANSYRTLNRLATALERVKTASAGFKLPDFSRLESLAQSLQDNFNAENGLKRMAEGMEAIKTASQGFKMPSARDMSKISQTINNSVAKDASEGVKNQVDVTLREVSERAVDVVNESMGNVNLNEMFDPANLPLGALGRTLEEAQQGFVQFGAMAKDTSDILTGSGMFDKVTPGENRVSNMADDLGAAKQEAEGLQEAMTDIIVYGEQGGNTFRQMAEADAEIKRQFEEIVALRREEYEEAERIRKAQEERFYAGDRKSTYSMAETNAMADNLTQLDLLKAKLHDAEVAYNKFVNLLGANDTKTIKAGLAVSDLRDKIWQLTKESEEATAQMTEAQPQELPVELVPANEATGEMFSPTLESILNGTYQPKVDVESLVDGKNKLELLQEKYQLVREEFANGLSMGTLDDKQINDYALKLTNLKDQIDTLQNKYDNLNGGGALEVMGEEARQAAEDFLSAKNQIEMLQMQVDALKQKLGNGIMTGTMDEAQLSRTAQQIERLEDKIRSLKDAEQETSTETSLLSFSFKSLFEQVKNNSLGKLAKQFTNIAKRMAIRAIIKSVTEAFGEGVENVYWYSKAIGGTFYKNMDNATSTMKQFKNSIGAAVSPLISSLVPAFQTIVNWLIEAVNYVNQFFSLLNGQSTWTKAVYNQSDAYEDTAKSAKNASDATKDLLADWDELNIIQNNNGSSGSGSSSNTTDYASMFEEVSEYSETIKTLVNGIEDQFGSIWKLAKKVGVAILAWKLSNTFSGLLGTLASLVAAAYVIDIAVNFATMFDNNYLDTGDEGWLIADILSTAIGGFFAGQIIKKLLGTGFGLITAGITFALSAGATFAASANASNGDMSSTLDLVGIFKLGMAGLLSGAGLYAAGASLGVSIFGGALLAVIAAGIKYSLDMEAEAQQTAAELATAAFSASGQGGINPQTYLDALQAQLDTYTAGHHLVVNAYADVPELKTDLTSLAEQLRSMNSVVSGTDSLTEEDAEAFKKVWNSIIETLDKINSKNYDTILAGLNHALAVAETDMQNHIKNIRTGFIQLEKNVDQQTAELYQEMEDIVSRIANGEEVSDEDIQKYTQINSIIEKLTDTTLSSLQEAIDAGQGLDFSNAEDPIAAAREYIQTVGESAAEAEKAVDESLENSKKAIEDKKTRLKAYYDSGYLDMTAEEYDAAMAQYNEIERILTDTAEKDKEKIRKAIDDAYEILFQTSFNANGSQGIAYWDTIIRPLVEDAENAGAEVPDAFKKGFLESIAQFHLGEEAAHISASKLIEFDTNDPKELAKKINNYIVNALRTNETIDTLLFKLIGLSKGNQENQMIDIAEKFGVTGFDMLEDNIKEQYAEVIRNVFGEDADAILKELGYSPMEAVNEALSGGSASATTEPIVVTMDDSAYQTSLEDLEDETENTANTIEDFISEIFTGSAEEIINNLSALSKGELGSLMTHLFPGSNPDLLNRPIVPDGEDYNTLLTETFTATSDGRDGLLWNQDLVMNLTPILPDGTKLTDDDFKAYVEDLLNKSANVDELFENDKPINGGKNLLISADVDFESFGDAVEEASALAWMLHLLQQAYYADQVPTEGLAENIQEDLEDVVDQQEIDDIIDILKGAFQSGFDPNEVLESLYGADGFTDAALNKVKEMFGGSIEGPELDMTGVTQTASAAAETVEDMANRMRGAFQSLDGITYSMDMFGETSTGSLTVRVPKISTAATGGFVKSGDLVMANENGQFEMMGKMGNQPVVANNQQIVNGITQGVATANGDVVSELRSLASDVRKILNKEFTVKYTANSTAGRYNQMSADAYSKVTG